jgi:ABC-type transport system involved in multi-copper enzyme maturation permease subunit
VPEALIGVNVDAVMRANGQFAGGNVGPTVFSTGDAPTWRGAIILLGWMTAFVVLAFTRFLRRDLQE